jgi:hypothetical protein
MLTPTFATRNSDTSLMLSRLLVFSEKDSQEIRRC